MFGIKGFMRAKKRWSITINDSETCLLKWAQPKQGKIEIEDVLHLNQGLSSEGTWQQIEALFDDKASFSLNLVGQGFHYQQLKLDSSLSAKEQRLFIAKQLSLQLSVEQSQLLLSCNSNTNKREIRVCEVLATTKLRVQPIINLLSRSAHHCVRLETAQLTLAWLAEQQRKQTPTTYWGIVEIASGGASLLVLNKQQIICQRRLSLADVVTDEKTKLTLLMQKLEQVMTLLGLPQAVQLFVTPSWFHRLKHFTNGTSICFVSLPTEDIVRTVQPILLSSHLAFCALALAHKTNVLN